MKINIKKSYYRITLAVIGLLFIFSVGQAQNSSDQLERDINEKQKQLNELNNEIQNYQQKINQKQKQAASLKNEVDLYDLQIRQTEIQIDALTVEIEKLSDEIKSIQAQILKKEEEIETQKKYLAETLQLINEYDTYTPLEITLGNNTFSEFLDQIQYANNLQEKNQELLGVIRQLKAELEEKQENLKKKLSDLEASKQQQDLALKSLETQRVGKATLLSRTRGEERIYQNLLSDASAKQEEIEREVYNLEVMLRQQLGDSSLPPIEGLLSWPASGVFTQGYGNTGFTSLGYSFHNGIDIAGPPGTKIYASGDGLIYATGTGEAAYGNWIVLKHTINYEGSNKNIYTLYAHLQGFAASTGQTVKSGDLIGYMGNTGNTTRLLYGPERGYHLHFSVFDEKGFSIKGGAYQHIYGPYEIPVGASYNPMNFLE